MDGLELNEKTTVDERSHLDTGRSPPMPNIKPRLGFPCHVEPPFVAELSPFVTFVSFNVVVWPPVGKPLGTDKARRYNRVAVLIV